MQSHFKLATSVLESLGDGIVFLDRDLCYVYVNPAAERLLLKPGSELLGRYVWDVFPQTPDSPFRGPIDEAVKTGQPTHVEALNVRRGVWFDVHSYPSEQGLAILFRDVTEQKQAEAALAESEARFRMMADAAPVMIWMSGQDRQCVYFNKGWLLFTGRPMERELGTGWTEGIHPDDLDRCLEIYATSFDRCEAFVMEYRLRRHDGAFRWVLNHGVPLFDTLDQFTGYIGSCIDIHERLHTEKQMAFLAEASTVLASSLDYEQTLRHVAELMVPHLADWCGVDVYNDAGVLERVTVAHVDPDKTAWAMEAGQRYPSDPHRPHSLAHVARAGEPVLVPHVPDEVLAANARDEEHLGLLRQLGFRSLIAVPLKARGASLGALMMVWAETENTYTDADLRFAQELAARAAIAIENARLYREAREAEAHLRALNETLEVRVLERTEQLEQQVQERLRAEEALNRVVQQLEDRNEELQEFAYVASHDLQEPLRKISTFADLLQEEYAGVLDDNGHLYIHRMMDASHRMSRLIHDLLEYSRVTTQGKPFTRVDLNKVVSVVLSDLEVRVRDVQGRVDVERLPTIEADFVQMCQLFQNLISNALKFHRPDAQPRVRITSILSDEGHVDGERCQIKVEDNGVGFEQKYADQIFLPFRRLHAQGDYPGTGVGLAIVQRIIRRHRGSILAQSTLGKGTTFVLILPVKQETVDSHVAA